MVFRAPGIPPVSVQAAKYTRGDKFVSFIDDHGNETSWFNTVELGGMWEVPDSRILGTEPNANFMSRKN